MFSEELHRAMTEAASRVWIEKGKLIQSVNAAGIAGYHGDYEITRALEYQLYDEDTRKPSNGTYRGQGVIRKVGTANHVITGDPYKDAQLPEYIMADKPTPESDKALDDAIEGIKAAFEPKSPKKPKGNSDVIEAYNEAMKIRKSPSFTWVPKF